MKQGFKHLINVAVAMLVALPGVGLFCDDNPVVALAGASYAVILHFVFAKTKWGRRQFKTFVKSIYLLGL